MIYNSITKNDTYVELSNGENGEKQIMPTSSVILVDDESGMIAIKTIGSRKTVALVKKDDR